VNGGRSEFDTCFRPHKQVTFKARATCRAEDPIAATVDVRLSERCVKDVADLMIDEQTTDSARESEHGPGERESGLSVYDRKIGASQTRDRGRRIVLTPTKCPNRTTSET
jgi:hypothetical protein